MNALTLFNFENFQVRTLMQGDEPWFVLGDLCKVLEMANPWNVAARLADDEKGLHEMETPGGKQNVTVVNEPGFYEVLRGSNKPVAKRLWRWVNHDVLPTLRKTGRYEMPGAKPAASGADVDRALAVLRACERLYGKKAARDLWPKLEALPSINISVDEMNTVHLADGIPGTVHARCSDDADFQIVADFATSRLIVTPGSMIQGKHMYEAYATYCRSAKVEPKTMTFSGRALKALGWEKSKINGKNGKNIYYLNVALRPDANS